MEFVLEPFSAATKISYQLNSIKYFFRGVYSAWDPLLRGGGGE